jgi:ABC-2 type transport system permease protein
MKRSLVVAQAEFLALIRSKFFILMIFLMPVLILGFMQVIRYASERVDREDRTFAVVDRTGVLYDRIVGAAGEFNLESGEGAARTGPHFLPTRVDPDATSSEALRIDLSNRVRAKEFFAFVEIPAEVLDPDATSPVMYYSESTAYDRLPSWLRRTLNAEIAKRRFEQAGVDPSLVAKLTADAELSTFGLVTATADGRATQAREVDEFTRFGVPIFFLVLMFMAVMSNAQHLINAVVEEKMSKISEVLLGSITAFELLAGKLLGVVGVSLLLTSVYFVGGIYIVLTLGRPDLIDPGLLAWFVVFVIAAVLMFGAIFLALGSACSNLKDAQSVLQPAMMLVLLAYFASFIVIRAPDSTISVALSFFPTVTPFAMMLRLAMPPGPPLWQVLLSVVLLFATTAAIVWAAGRIFRVGLLMQGKAPNLPELMKWIGA